MTDKINTQLLLDDKKEAVKSVIAQMIKSGKRNTRNGIVGLLTEKVELMITEALDEMTKNGHIKQTRDDAFYELTKTGEKELL